MAVNNTENEKKKNNAFFYLTDCSPYEDRSIQSFPDFSVICHDRNVTIARSAHRGMWHITPPQADISVILTLVTNCNHAWSQGNYNFYLVKFLLSFAAFTEVLVSVYTRKMFTWVSKLSYLSKPFKSKHGVSVQKKLVSSTAYYPSQVRYDSVLAFRDRLQMILTRENSGLHCKREHRHIPGRS